MILRPYLLAAGAAIAISLWALALMGDGMHECQAAGTPHDVCALAIMP